MAQPTNKAIYVINPAASPVTRQLAPENLNSDVLTNGVYRSLVGIDWGRAPKELFEIDNSGGDGILPRGHVYGARDILFSLNSRVNVPTIPTNKIEAVRDDELDFLQGFLSPDYGLYTLKQTRLNASLAAVSRIIRAHLMDWHAWKWQPDDFDDGHVGTHDMPHLIVPLAFRAPFPWFQSEVAAESTDNTLDGTTRTAAPVNAGIRRTGLRAVISGSGSGLTITILNTTSGADTDIVGSTGITLTGIDMAGGNVIVDWYATDPLAYSVTQGSTNLIASGKLAGGSRIYLAKGTNQLTHRVTVGTLTGGTISYYWYELWGQP